MSGDATVIFLSERFLRYLLADSLETFPLSLVVSPDSQSSTSP